MWWRFACLQMSTLCLNDFWRIINVFCVPDICPRVCIETYEGSIFPREKGVYWVIWSRWNMSFNIIPVASENQEIHSYSTVNIYSVKSQYFPDEIMNNPSTIASSTGQNRSQSRLNMTFVRKAIHSKCKEAMEMSTASLPTLDDLLDVDVKDCCSVRTLSSRESLYKKLKNCIHPFYIDKTYKMNTTIIIITNWN